MRDSELIFGGTVAAGVDVGQRVSASGATNGSYDIDTLAAGDAMKAGAVFKAIATEILAGTGTTVTITLVTCAEPTFASATTLFSTGAIAKASTVAHTVLAQVVIPVGVLRYLRVIYTTDNTMETTGRISSWIELCQDVTLDRQL